MQRIVYTRQQELPLGIHFAPAIVREHGLRDAHVQPLVSRTRGESFRVHARHAWGYPSLELRAGNSWPALTLDCDLPTVVDALHSLKSEFPLPAPNMVVERVSNGHADPARLEIAGNPDHRGGRNCSLFRSLQKWAGSPFNLELEVLAMARATNEQFEIGSTVFGSKKVSQGAVSAGAPFSPLNQRL